jgi:hypothetical protein
MPEGDHTTLRSRTNLSGQEERSPRREMGMPKRETSKFRVTRREGFDIGDEPDHSITIVEMQGEPVDYQAGVAGKFVSRRSVTVHDRVRGWGLMQGYVMTYYEQGTVYSRFEGRRDGLRRITEGTWTTYHATGKLSGSRGAGKFKLLPGEETSEFILEIEGDFEAA